MAFVCSRLKMRHLVLYLLESTGHWNWRLKFRRLKWSQKFAGLKPMQNAVECVYALDFPLARMARALARRSLKCSSQLKPDTNAVAEIRSDPLAHLSAGLSAKQGASISIHRNHTFTV